MTYKAIATILYDPERNTAQLELAISLAQKFDAHLHILCAGVDDSEPGFYYAGAHAVAVQQNFDLAENNAHAVEAIARKRMLSETLQFDVQVVTVLPGGLLPFLADNMRFHDLIVLPSPYQGASGRIDALIFEACLFDADRPVMIMPEPPIDHVTFSNIMLAWDDGCQAMAAAREAAPLIAQADLINVTMIDPPANAPDRSDPGGQLAGFLAQRGGQVEISILSRSQPSIASQLLARAAEQGTDLIVMGAYGHSRLREAILGGATRDMLRVMNLPVLMAH